jgi:hypothetical protein
MHEWERNSTDGVCSLSGQVSTGGLGAPWFGMTTVLWFVLCHALQLTSSL